MDWLFGQLQEFDKFAGYKRSLMEDTAYARLALKQMIEEHVCLIAFAENPAIYDQPVGFISGWRTPHPFNPRISVLTECFWWVAKAHRGGRAGLMLLDAFESIGRKYCDWVVMTLEHHSPVSEKHLFKRGFVAREKSYLVEV